MKNNIQNLLGNKVFWAFSTLFCLTTLSACSHNQTGKSASKVYELLFSMGNLAYDPAQAERLPYASIAMAAGRGAKILMLPVQASGNRLSWIASNRVVLVTEQGRLVKTAGLSDNLSDTRFAGDKDWIGALPETLAGRTIMREIDFLERQRVAIPVRCQLEIAGQAVIQIHQRQHQTTQIIEHCQSGGGLKWQFDNQFWVDTATPNLVWKSVQHFAPTLPRLTIEQIKHYQPQS